MTRALVIGGGPAGLMAADTLLGAGLRVTLAEAKPSLGRKFLMAGKSGLNLTKMEDPARFLAAYPEGATQLAPMIDAFGPKAARDWAEALGQVTFTGSTGRLFPKAMKASPLLRAWLARLDGMGLERHVRWRWKGWEGDALFDTPRGPQSLAADVTVLALGGGSWARLGSDGLWAEVIAREGVKVTPFQPSNAGLRVDWSAHMTRHFGAPLKNVAFHAGDRTSRGEAVISAKGLEGGGIYPLSPALRSGGALCVDLLPDLPVSQITQRLDRASRRDSLSNRLRKALKLSLQAQALLMECARPLPADSATLAKLIKHLPVSHTGLRPLDEAISTTGGVAWESLDSTLMLRARPGTFCAGEMIGWDAPTGGYLLTACLATGLWAGRHAAAYCQR